MSDTLKREELEEVIGARATDELLRAWGGTHFRFPSTLPDDHPMLFVVGRYNAELLCLHFGSCACDLPIFDDRDIQRRNVLIFERLTRDNATQNQVAGEFGLTVRTVRAIFTTMKEQKTA
jgi:hypothetical protein